MLERECVESVGIGMCVRLEGSHAACAEDVEARQDDAAEGSNGLISDFVLHFTHFIVLSRVAKT